MLIVKGYLTREDNFRAEAADKVFWTPSCPSEVRSCNLYFQSSLLCSDMPRCRVFRTLTNMASKGLKEIALLLHVACTFLLPPIRNVTVRNFQYKEVILGTPS